MISGLLIAVAVVLGASIVYGTDYGPGRHLSFPRRMALGTVQSVLVLALAWASFWGPGSPIVFVVWAAAALTALLTALTVHLVRQVRSGRA